MRILIGVIGSGGPITSPIAALAFEVGAELGRRGISLVCGGLAGVMQAASEGLRTARDQHATSALAIGVLPSDDPSTANPFLDIAIPSGLGIARNALVVHSAAALIVIGGESGTLSEVAMAWQLGKPIVALAPSGGVAAQMAGQPVDGRRSDVIVAALTARDAVDQAMKGFVLPK